MKVSIKDEKCFTRKRLLKLRDEIPNKREKSLIITKTLLDQEIVVKSNQILVYYSTSNEVDTRELVDSLFSLNKSLFLPSTRKILITKFEPDTLLIKQFGEISEPITTNQPNPKRIDLAIVPGVGFDEKGNRLGRGGGWYDKLFDRIKVGFIIGVCFDEQIMKTVPLEDHDMAVDMVITDSRIFYPA